MDAEARAGAEVAAVEGQAAAVTPKVRPLWAYPATYVLVGINLAVFAVMCRHTALAGYWRHGVWGEMFTSVFEVGHLVDFGACERSAVLDGNQWWRVLTATFVHVNTLHLLLNMWCLWNLGLLGEPLLGRPGLGAVYALTGVAGNLLSLGWAVATGQPLLVAGASGAVFGIAGILIVLLSHRGLLERNPGVTWKDLSGLRLQVIFFAVANLALGYAPLGLPLLPGDWLARAHVDLATMPRVDNTAHLGGFLSGLALGVALFPRMTGSTRAYKARQRAVFATAGFVLCLVGYAVRQFAK